MYKQFLLKNCEWDVIPAEARRVGTTGAMCNKTNPRQVKFSGKELETSDDSNHDMMGHLHSYNLILGDCRVLQNTFRRLSFHFSGIL